MLPHRFIRSTLLGAFVLLLGIGRAHATPMTWEFLGTTTSISTPLSGYFGPATPVVFTLTFDPTHPELTGNAMPFEGQYRFNGETRDYFNFEARIGDRHYAWSQRTAQLNVYANQPSLVLDTSLFGSAVQGDILGTATLWHPVMLDFAISWLGMGSPGSLALPVALPASDFAASLQLGFSPNCDPLAAHGCGAGATVDVQLTKVRQVPAPPTLLLVGLGLLGAVAYRRLRGTP